MLLDGIKQKVQNIPVAEEKDCTPAERAWNNYMNSLRELILHDDIREFLHWRPIVSTMFVESPPYIQTELKHISNRDDWQNRWEEAIKESRIGHPTPCIFYPTSSGNLIHHSYHVCQFEEKTGINVDKIDLVFEFGGGYGSMCRLFHRLGFKGKYVIYDLPVFSALQKYYLCSLDLPVYSLDSFKSSKSGIICISGLEILKYFFGDYDKRTNSLFLATWSLSETPVSLRNQLLLLLPQFDSYLMSYQEHFQEVNNQQFFTSWKNNYLNIKWHEWEIRHLPQNYYLIGVGAHLK